MSAIIFSGAAQILACQLLAAGAPVAVVILTCSVLGLRFLMYSAAMAPYLQAAAAALAARARVPADRPGVRRLDPQVRCARRCARAARRISWAAAWRCGVSGRSTNVVGFFAGNVIPAAWSLEFTVPLCFLALLAPALRSAPHVCAAVVAGVAVLALDALPMRLNLVVAGLLGIVAGTAVEMARERWKAR